MNIDLNSRELRISIIVPTYNSEKFLGTLLESISQQSIKPFEVILVDNVSTDRTLEVARTYEVMLNINVICEKDKGQGDAVTKGLLSAKGDIHHWHASDDILAPEALAHITKVFKQRNDVDLVFSDGLSYFPGESRLFSSWPTHGLTKNQLIYKFARFQSDTCYWRASISLPSLPLRNDIPLMVDEEFFLRLVDRSRKILRVKQSLGIFRIRAGQISQITDRGNIHSLRQEFRETLYARHEYKPGELTLRQLLAEIQYINFTALGVLNKIIRTALRLLGRDPYGIAHAFVLNCVSAARAKADGTKIGSQKSFAE